MNKIITPQGLGVARITRHLWPWLWAVSLLVVLMLLPPRLAMQLPLAYLLLLPVMLAAYAGGWLAGICMSVVGALLLMTGVVPLGSAQGMQASANAVAIWATGFVLCGLAISILTERLRRATRRAEMTRQLHRSTLMHVDDIVVVTNSRGVIRYVNRSACALLGLEERQLMNQAFLAMFDVRSVLTGSAADILLTQHQMRSYMLSGQAEYHLHCPDGRKVPVEISVTPVRGADGDLRNVVYTLRDRTLQYEAERAVRERLTLQEQLEQVARSLPGAIHELWCGVDGSVRLLYASRGFQEMTDISPQAFSSDASELLCWVHPGDLPLLIAAYDAARQQLQRIDLEFRVQVPGREPIWVALHTQPSREADGALVFHGVINDISERKLQELVLREGQRQLQTALEAGGMGLLVMDVDEDRVQLDQMAQQMLRLELKSGETIGLDRLMEQLHPDTREEARARHLDMCKGPGVCYARCRLKPLRGMEHWVEIRGRFFRDEVTGHLVKVGILMDVTATELAAERQQHSQKLEALGVLAGGIAHDFNNLLLSISGNAQLIMDELPSNHLAQDNLADIDRACARAGALIRRILTFSRPDDEDEQLREVPLDRLLNEAVRLARVSAPENIALHSDISAGVLSLWADEGHVLQALLNLLSNAVDAIGSKAGSVTCGAQQVTLWSDHGLQEQELLPGDYVRIDVEDNGPGIPANQLQRIFDPFFTTKGNGRGTGLGLSIVHGVMKKHGGAVTVHSEPGQGTRFSLYFPVRQVNGELRGSTPLVREAVNESTAMTAALTTSPHALPSASLRARILYVDDEEALLHLMSRTLKRQDHAVLACSTPQQALEVFARDPSAFDLLVTDVAMPVMSGLELAKHALTIRPDLRVVVITGYVSASDVERARALGVYRLITKPDTVLELSTLIGELASEVAVVRRVSSQPASANATLVH